MPYGFGVFGVVGCAGVDGAGDAARSAGEVGRPGQFVLDREDEVVDEDVDPEVEDPESDMEDKELLLSVRVNADPPNSDFAGDVVIECPGDSDRLGDACGEAVADCGICTSLRTTMRERWRRFRVNRLET